jgi:pyridoxal phosphate enzyme (YggS family)
MNGGRREQIAGNLADVRARIAAAAEAAGRDPAAVTLVAITKTRPATDVALLAELGVGDVGENRDQEGSAKRAATEALGPPPLRWHMVGRLQTNKAKSVARWADVVQSVDRVELVGPLDRAAEHAQRRLGICLQVSLDGDPDRGGALPERIEGLAEQVAARHALELLGLMAVAPLGEEPEAAFGRLAEVQQAFLAQHPEATVLSAGMSGDLEAAVRLGATHVRVGTALLGTALLRESPPGVR